jgi:heptosyltransferase-2
MNLTIFLPNWIGDVMMATPALRALRKRFPQAHFTGIMRPYVADVLAGKPWFDETLFYKPGAKDRELRAWSLIRKVRDRRPDAAVLFPNSLSTALIAWASGARERIGYIRYGRGPLLTTKLRHPRQRGKWLPTPGIDAYLQLASAMGCDWESPRMEAATTDIDELAADQVWEKFQLPPGNDVVVLNSGGAFGAAKLWPTEYFAELAGKIAVDHGLSVLVNCGPAEKKIAAEIVRQANHPRVVSLADEEVPIGLTKACIRRSRLLVTTDSGPRFFGVAFGVPTVSLFGPTHIAWSRTHAEHEICLSHQVPCGPCMKRVCPLGHHRCMRDLTVATVLAAVEQQLQRTDRQRATIAA